jgi:DNA polymerase III epsilon subunit-like protein
MCAMTKQEIFNKWRKEILPELVKIENKSPANFPDKPMRRQSFNDFVDYLQKEGKITTYMAYNIVIRSSYLKIKK